MVLLYISCVHGHSDAGPNFSIPASIKAQSKFDQVFWINTINVIREEWKELPFYHNLKEFGNLDLNILPAPFSSPDIVVFEELYSVKAVKFARGLRHRGIPYIIVPRGSMTKQAFNNHSKWKKILTHPFLFNPFINGASLIQYLSEEEWKNTRKFKELPHAIIPNGINSSPDCKIGFSKDSIKGVFIGRLDVYQKGLDILVHSISNLKDLLREKCFTLSIYGTEKTGVSELKATITNAGIDDLVMFKGPTYGEEKKKVLLDSDVFFLTSRSEGHPMGLIEALDYGLPAFVTTGTGQRKNIETAGAGWGCELDVREMSESLRKMVESKSEYGSMSVAAKQLAQRFEWSRIAESFHETIINVINKNNGRE